MTASGETWNSYAQLLTRLIPKVSHILFASPDGSVWWSSDARNASRVQYALALLQNPAAPRNEVDGLVETEDSAESRFGFRVRGALGELLGLIVIALPMPDARLDLREVHALIKPALDCLQSELSARTTASIAIDELDLLQRLAESAGADGWESLAQIPELANQHLSGIVAAILLPERNLTLCHKRPDQPSGIESGVLAQMHRHLTTRAQLHGRTLVANRLALDGTNAALPYKAISTPIRDETRRVVGVLAVFRAATDGDFQRRDAEVLETLARKAAQIARLSFDPVTGLLTAAAFRAHAGKLAAQELKTSTHGLLYLDIDQLSVVNENHGMHVGDEVIQGVASLLSRRAREGTLVARLGGDRFCMLVPGCGIEPAARIAEELRSAAIRLSGARGDKPLLVSLSIGVARLGDRDRLLDHAMAAAELACRTAKERGRNRVEVFYGNAKNPAGRATLGFIAQVNAALTSESIELLAQPILPLSSKPADPRFEILLRMRAPDGSRLGLEKLIEDSGSQELAREVDRWAIEQVLERLAACRPLLKQYPAKFSLNLSAASLADTEFWRMLEDLVRNSRIEPGTLGFEFPEEAASAHLGTIAPCMGKLRELGIAFALDNFGRGIGSLSHLNLLPVSCIKIDGSFSRNLLDNPKSQSMVVAIAKLAGTFGLETVAGCVETDAIRARAAQLGVDYGQGFLIGKPLPLDDAVHDLPLYACFETSTGLFDPSMGKIAALRN